jgi:molecular chaperone GrpE (heat shock protein)
MADIQWQKMANLVFEIEKKVLAKEAHTALQRIQDKMKRVLEEAGVYIYDPTGEKYNETRTDVEASISGSSTSELVITDVIKPILYTANDGRKQLIQQGVVIVTGH